MFWREMLTYNWPRPSLFFWWLLIPLAIWEIILKGFALWRAAQHKQKGWFIAVLIINSVGILPIVYLLFFQKKKK